MRTIVTARNTDVSDIREIIEARFTNLTPFDDLAHVAAVGATRPAACAHRSLPPSV